MISPKIGFTFQLKIESWLAKNYAWSKFKRVLHYKMEFGSLRVLSPPFQGLFGDRSSNTFIKNE